DTRTGDLLLQVNSIDEYRYSPILPTMKIMRRITTLAMTALWLCAAAAPHAQEPPKTAPATHVTKDQIDDFIAHMAPDRIADSPIRAVDVGGYRGGGFP